MNTHSILTHDQADETNTDITQKVFSVFDTKAKAYMTPFHARNEHVAMRMFSASAADPNNHMHAYGADFHLFEIGIWNEDKGLYSMLNAPINHGNALQLMELQDIATDNDQEIN